MKRKRIVWILAGFVLVLFFATGCIWYLNDFYPSDSSVNIYLSSTEQVSVTKISDGFFFDGMGEDVALIFYPGAKVQDTAYAPLLYQLAERGVDCFLVHMPYNLAIFGQNKADEILHSFDYKRWYIGGHSLGGAMAASYASKKKDVLNGLVLLAAYPIKSLKSEYFSVVSIYGSEDLVLNRKKLEEGREFMPQNYTEVCIEGGNHAQFGNYGIQDKDGVATIDRETQQKQTLESILKRIEADEKSQ